MLHQNWRIVIYNVYLQFLGNGIWDLEGGAVRGRLKRENEVL